MTDPIIVQYEFDWQPEYSENVASPLVGGDPIPGAAHNGRRYASNDCATHPRPPAQPMFWVLISLAATAFVPCCILPVWRDYQAIKMAERLEAATIENLRAHVEFQERHLDALRTDPVVVSRTALRDLGYRRPDESSVRLHPTSNPLFRPASRQWHPAIPGVPVIANLDNPATSRRTAESIHAGLIPKSATIFIDPRTRSMLMCLAAALVITAFILYSPRRRPMP